jgi:small nuclear ribonucleoprotein B and B'
VEGPPPASADEVGAKLAPGLGVGAPAGRGMGLGAPTMCVHDQPAPSGLTMTDNLLGGKRNRRAAAMPPPPGMPGMAPPGFGGPPPGFPGMAPPG